MDYKAINKATWNKKTDVHIASDFYAMEAFKAGKSSLKEIELALLGDINGKSVLHLQCHFGQDTLSMARMGARVTGVDLSDRAIERATELAAQLGLEAEFVCCDVYDTLQHVTEKFDIVYTTYGTIGWLPDLEKWAAVIAGALKPGGRLVFVEFHPVVWMFDYRFTEVAYPYFKAEPIIETETGTYADRGAELQNQTVSWNHGLAEVLGSLLGQGLRITRFNEYDYSPYPIFAESEEAAPGRYRVKGFGNKLPLVYALEAVKESF